MKVFKASKNKVARELTYRTVIGILPILQRFSKVLGINDINELSSIICKMSVDEFCDFKLDKPDDVASHEEVLP